MHAWPGAVWAPLPPPSSSSSGVATSWSYSWAPGIGRRRNKLRNETWMKKKKYVGRTKLRMEPIIPEPLVHVYRVPPPKKKGTVDFLGLCSDQQLSLFTCWIEYRFLIVITPRSSNLVENLFILWVITYGLSFSGFAIDLSLIVPRNSAWKSGKSRKWQSIRNYS